MKSQVTAKIILDTRRPKKDGLYPLKIRVTFQRAQKYYPVLGQDQSAMDMTEEEFEKVFSQKPRGDNKAQREHLDMVVAVIKQKIAALPVFTFEQLEEKLFGKQPGTGSDVEQIFQRMIADMQKDERLSTAEGYQACLRQLLLQKKNLKLADITPAFLKDFHKAMAGQGKSISTIGIYMRYLRSVFNEAIATGIADRQSYPFGREKGKYQIPSSVNVKKALTKAHVKQIFDYQTENQEEQKARDFWILSYLCNGINPKDIAQLKISDIDLTGNKLSFYRSKTSSRVNTMEKIEVALLPKTIEIIKRWGNFKGQPDDFVFPIFTKKMDAKQRKLAKDLWVQFMNRNTKRIGQKLGIEINITTIVARHTFATVLLRSGATQEFIRESLGHTDLKTTANYLGSFEDDTRQKNALLLVDF